MDGPQANKYFHNVIVFLVKVSQGGVGRVDEEERWIYPSRGKVSTSMSFFIVEISQGDCSRVRANERRRKC